VSWTEHHRVVALRRRWAVVDLVAEVMDGWRLHLTGRNAAVLTYYGFLSIFPLFMVATTILGFVLQDNPELLDKILDTAVSQIPVIGTQISEAAGQLGGNGLTVAIGLVVALWAATRGFVGLQVAFDDAWEIPVDQRGNIAQKRGRALLGVLIIGTGLIGATALTSISSFAELAAVSRALLLVFSFLVNTTVLGAMYRYLGARWVGWRLVVPGAVLGGFAFTLFQIAGVTIVDRFINRTSDTAGVFAVVFALMAWLNLHATTSLFGAELNAALVRRRTRSAMPVPMRGQASNWPATSSSAEDRPTSTS
jgi:membrane protein